MAVENKRKLAAILFADIVGYTSLMQDDEHHASNLLRHFQHQIEEKVNRYSGRIVNFYGDGCLCTFETPIDAVHCAMDLQKVFFESVSLKTPVRIGIHSGTVTVEGEKIFGDSVNITSRIESMGVAGGILLSKKVRDEVKNNPELKLHPLGNFEFKNVKEPVEVFALANEGLVVPKRSELRHIVNEIIRRPKTTALSGWMIPAILGLLLIGVAGVWYYNSGKAQTDVPIAFNENSIAVLPFRNDSNEEENEYFCNGIMDDVLNQLQKIGALKVISRSSVMHYQKNPKPIPVIGRELGVNYVVEGSVRKSGNRVLVSAQLINAREEGFIWGEQFNKELNVDNIFEIQSSIAKEIAGVLEAEITAAEKASIEQKPTENLEAYDYFLRGKYFYDKRGFNASTLIPRALDELEKAVALDSNFALAHASLGYCHDHMYWHGIDHTPARAALAKKHFNKALELAPDNPRVLAGKGWYFYHVERNYDAAIAMFTRLQKEFPNNMGAFNAMGVISGRMGNWKASAENFEKAYALNPSYKQMLQNSGLMHHRARNYEKAESIYDRLINIAPDDAEGYTLKTTLYLQWKGDVGEAMQVINESKLPIEKYPFFWAVDLKMIQKDYEGALKELTGLSASTSRNNSSRRRNIHKGLARLYRYIGEEKQSRLHADTACILLEQRIEKFPTVVRLYRDLAVMQALKGDKQKAMFTAEKGIEMMPLSLDAYLGHQQELALAKVYALCGEEEKAIEKLDFLLSTPGFLSGHMLRMDPIWDALRTYPEFQKLTSRGVLKN